MLEHAWLAHARGAADEAASGLAVALEYAWLAHAREAADMLRPLKGVTGPRSLGWSSAILWALSKRVGGRRPTPEVLGPP